MTDDSNNPVDPDKARWGMRFIAALQKKIPNLTTSCPSCGQNRVVADFNMWSPVNITLGGGQVFGPTFPVGILFCEHCGFSRHYNLIMLNVVDRSGKLIDG